MRSILSAIRRKKTNYEEETSELARVLALKDLVFLGVGSSLGLGAYVLAGQVAKSVAGPAVCLSFLVAAFTCLFGGLCYAEFAARVPRAGWSYIYSYISVGEGIAFLIGWNLILGCLLSISSTASGLSAYIDSIAGSKIKDALTDSLPINLHYLSPYPDFLAFGIVVVATILFSFGVRGSSNSQNFFAILNLATICTAVIAASIKINGHNWNIKVDDIAEEYRSTAGSGGFLPFGLAGVIAGAPRCFYGFGGFDTASSCGAEAKNPRRDIPLSIMISLVIVFIIYLSISMVLTLALPYYLQSENAAFVHIFQELDWTAIKWIVSIGAIFALCSTLLGSIYPLPRIMYAMASDGLLFKPFAKVYSKTKIPLMATLAAGILSSVIAAILNLEDLLDMISLGGLLAYVIVSASIVTLRYDYDEISSEEKIEQQNKEDSLNLIKKFYIILNIYCCQIPNHLTSRIVTWCIINFGVCSFVLCAILTYGDQYLRNEVFLAVLIVTLSTLIVLTVIIARQPQKAVSLSFKVPLVPYIPCLSIFTNSYLMVQLGLKTWLLTLGWMVIGFTVYIFYGIRHSEETEENRKLRTQQHEKK